MNFSENAKKKGIKVFNKEFSASEFISYADGLVTEARAFVPLKNELPPINSVDASGKVTRVPKEDL